MLAPLLATAAPALAASTSTLAINEIDADASPDWIELKNTGTATVDASGLVLKDEQDSNSFTIPAGTTIPAGGYAAFDIEDFGLGKDADSARLYDSATLLDSFSWTKGPQGSTWGRCADGTGAFTGTTSATKGWANACPAPVVINEIQADGDPDWVELANTGDAAFTAGGMVIKDDNDKNSFTIPAGTSIPAHGYAAFELKDFGLGKDADSVRLFQGKDLVDSFSWDKNDKADGLFGRCPDASGPLGAIDTASKGRANACPTAWPGSQDVSNASKKDYFGTNLSSLSYADGVMWAVKNEPSTLYKLAHDGANWTGAGTALSYPDGHGDVDAEGVAATADGIFVSAERDNDDPDVFRPGILRYGPDGGAAQMEWDLTGDLPDSGDPNLGLEGLDMVPDAVLTAGGFIDESTGAAYNPGNYPDHGSGIYFAANEADGKLYGYALNQYDGSDFTRVATIDSGLEALMEVQYDAASGALWASCDNHCDGRQSVLKLDATGHFASSAIYERPENLPNYNLEGFTLGTCSGGSRPAWWANDDADGGIAILEGSVHCGE